MIQDRDIRLAVPGDAPRIAVMSRIAIEYGLGWRWTPDRVLRSICNINSCVPVVHDGDQLIGFGIASYGGEEGHLLLLAVHASHRRQGIGAGIVSWLEDTALVAGIGMLYLEARAGNATARAFYGKLGYREISVIPGYYQGTEDCVRMGKDLWAHAQS